MSAPSACVGAYDGARTLSCDQSIDIHLAPVGFDEQLFFNNRGLFEGLISPDVLGRTAGRVSSACSGPSGKAARSQLRA